MPPHEFSPARRRSRSSKVLCALFYIEEDAAAPPLLAEPPGRLLCHRSARRTCALPSAFASAGGAPGVAGGTSNAHSITASSDGAAAIVVKKLHWAWR